MSDPRIEAFAPSPEGLRMETAGSGSRERLDSVQLLRAIAAIDIVVFHTPFYALIGSWGVTLFFVISGFIVCYVTETTGVHFMQKRILRIVPLYWAGTLCVFGIALAMPSLVQNTTTDVGSLLKSLAFIPFYKGQIIQPVLFLGWTLNFEMFFYLLFAISVRLSHRYRAVICSVLIIGIVVAGQLFSVDVVVWRFFTQPIILDFILGMFCFTVLKAAGFGRSHRRRFASKVAFTGLGTAFLVSMPLSIGQGSGATNLTPGVAGGIELGILSALALCSFVYGLSGVVLPRPVVLIGDASYSLYLFHPYVIQLFGKVFRAFDSDTTAAHLSGLLAIVLCCVLAVLLYRYVERPVTRYLRRRLLSEGGRRSSGLPRPGGVDAR